MNTRQQKITPQSALILGLIAVFGIRLFFVLNHTGLWGVDGGAYLLSQHYVLTGDQIVDFKRPWLAPGYLLVPFTWAFGFDMGIKAFALAAWLPMLWPLWLLARLALSAWATVWALIILSLGLMLAEMFVAGALPMVAFAGLFFALWGIWHLGCRSATWRHRVAVAGGIAWIAYTNQTTVGIAAYVLPVWAAFTFWLQRGVSWRRFVCDVGGLVFAGVVLALPTVMFYTQVAPGSGMLRYPGPIVALYEGGNALWYYTAMFAVVGVFAFLKGPPFVRALAALMLVSLPIGAIYSYDESILNITYRTRYLYTVYFYILIVWGAWRYVRGRRLVAIVVAAFVFILPFHVYQLHFETKLKRMVSADVYAGIEYLDELDFPGGIGANSYSMGLFVAAYTNKPVAWLQVYDPPPAYAEQHGNMACLVAWRSPCDPRAASEALGVDYLLVERLWPAVKDEIGLQVEGLGVIYNVFDVLSVDEFKQFGATWEAPVAEGDILPADPHPWDITTEKAHWLDAVWESGSAKIWRVNHAYFENGNALAPDARWDLTRVLGRRGT